MSIEIKTTAGYLIHLIKTVIITGTKPEEKPEALSWEGIYKLAEFHNVSNIAFYAVDKLESKPDDDLYRKWKEVCDKAAFRDVIQRREFAHLCSVFSENNIRILPLKGCIMKSLYPRTDYRVMADLDFLIDGKNARTVYDLMINEKYHCEKFEGMVHDTYHKLPVMNVEIHSRLISDKYPILTDYYKNIFDRCSPSAENPFVYEMTSEDFYIYQIVHLYKHYSGGGTGIRSVIDIYLLNHSEKFKFDRAKADAILKSLELAKFEKDICTLAEIWFGSDSETAESMENSKFIITSGTYGTLAHGIEQAINEQGRLRSFFHRLFLDYNTLKYMFPVLKKYPLLMPFYQLKRIFKAIFKEPKKFLYIFKLFTSKQN